MKTTKHRAGKRILCLMLCMALSGGAWAGAVDYTCPDCGKEIRVFGESHIAEIAEKHGVQTVARLPIDPKLAAGCDAGMIELFDGNWLNELIVEITKSN